VTDQVEESAVAEVADPVTDAQPEAPAGTGAEPETLAVPLAELRPALEAVLMVADQPLDRVTLATAVGHPVAEVDQALAGLAAEYDEQGRGFELRNVAGGWRYYTREDYAPVVEGFVLEGQQARLTQAALETLAVVAYKQPVSRARVSAVRGVNVDGVMRTLLTRGLVEEAGQDGETGANLYRTTTYFLERIGITSLDELPELAPYLPDMDDLEDELAAVAGATPAMGQPAPAAEDATEEPQPGAGPESEPGPEPGPEPPPTEPAPHHASPHSGDGTEPDGGTEPT
jgi:segregation and condensation protein B